MDGGFVVFYWKERQVGGGGMVMHACTMVWCAWAVMGQRDGRPTVPWCEGNKDVDYKGLLDMCASSIAPRREIMLLHGIQSVATWDASFNSKIPSPAVFPSSTQRSN